MALDLFLAALCLAYGAIFNLVAWVAAFLFLGDLYFRLWRRRVRRALFYDDHFEVSGWGVSLKGRYDSVENLRRVKAVLGDFRTGSRVWFSLKGDPNMLVLPNRKGGEPRTDLYSWLLAKNPRAAS